MDQRDHKIMGKEQNRHLKGHIYAILSMLICGSAFISTKVLLERFSPGEMVFLRFVLGYITLWVLKPRKLTLKSKKDEVLCALGGLFGVTLYYGIQNVALTQTSASNVSVIASTAPMMTAVMVYLLYRQKKPSVKFIVGLILSLAGVILVVSNGKLDFSGGMMGNLLALVSTFMWACFSVLIEKLSGYSMLLITRRVFFYGLLTMIPVLIVSGISIDVGKLFKGAVFINMLYVGCIASAVSNVIWNTSFQILGAVKTNIYMYTLPVITIILSFIFLHEKITLVGTVGIVITMVGMILAQKKE